MINVLIILFVVTILYAAIVDRLKSFVQLLSAQGILLFGIAYMHLQHIDVVSLGFILTETIVVKGFLIPLLLFRSLRRLGITRDTDVEQTHFWHVVIVTFIMLASFLIAHTVHDQHIRIGYFTASITALFTGLFIIMARRKIITHVMGYLLLENGIFMLSLAVGNEMPLAVSAAILLDLLSSVLLLAFLVDKVGTTFQTTDVNELNELTD